MSGKIGSVQTPDPEGVPPLSRASTDSVSSGNSTASDFGSTALPKELSTTRRSSTSILKGIGTGVALFSSTLLLLPALPVSIALLGIGFVLNKIQPFKLEVAPYALNRGLIWGLQAYCKGIAGIGAGLMLLTTSEKNLKFSDCFEEMDSWTNFFPDILSGEANARLAPIKTDLILLLGNKHQQIPMIAELIIAHSHSKSPINAILKKIREYGIKDEVTNQIKKILSPKKDELPENIDDIVENILKSDKNNEEKLQDLEKIYNRDATFVARIKIDLIRDKLLTSELSTDFLTRSSTYLNSHLPKP